MKIKLSAALGENLPDTFLDVGSTPTVSTNKKARKGHFLLVEKGRKEATSKNAEEGVGSNPGVRWKEGHPENRSQGAKPAKAAPKASLTAGCSHRNACGILYLRFWTHTASGKKASYGYVYSDVAIVLAVVFIFNLARCQIS